jgi:hypothetical protein
LLLSWWKKRIGLVLTHPPKKKKQAFGDESLGFMALGEAHIFPSDFLLEMRAGLGCEVAYPDEEQIQMVFIG